MPRLAIPNLTLLSLILLAADKSCQEFVRYIESTFFRVQ